MKLVFAHDHKLRKINDEYYTGGGLSDSITNRSTDQFDELTIIRRVIEKQEFDTQLFKISNQKISIKAASSGSIIPNRQAINMIENEIKDADGLIVKLHSKIAEIAIRYARKYKIPYLIESVACPWDSYWNYNKIGKIIAPIMTFSTKREIKRAPYVIYVTKEFLQKRYPTIGKNIDCSDVELKKIDNEVLKNRLEKIKSQSKELVLGTLAQVDVRYKGQEYVIKAIAKLKQRGYIFRYRVAGSGDNSYLKAVAEKYNVLNQVEFYGVLAHSDVFEWLDDIDIYIQPSKQEGLPRAMIEAISRACPAIGSTAGGIGELIDNKYIFNKGSVKDICEILIHMDANSMILQAKSNFNTSKNYDKNFLDKKRNKFYREFAEICKQNSK